MITTIKIKLTIIISIINNRNNKATNNDNNINNDKHILSITIAIKITKTLIYII